MMLQRERDVSEEEGSEEETEISGENEKPMQPMSENIKVEPRAQENEGIQEGEVEPLPYNSEVSVKGMEPMVYNASEKEQNEESEVSSSQQTVDLKESFAQSVQPVFGANVKDDPQQMNVPVEEMVYPSSYVTETGEVHVNIGKVASAPPKEGDLDVSVPTYEEVSEMSVESGKVMEMEVSSVEPISRAKIDVKYDESLLPVWATCTKEQVVVSEDDQMKKWANVLFVGTNGRVIAYDINMDHSLKEKHSKITKDNIIWQTKLFSTGLNVDRVVLFFDPASDLLFCTHQKSVYCLNPATGSELWKNEDLNHDSQYILSLPEGVYTLGVSHLHRFDKRSGQVHFHVKFGGGSILTQNCGMMSLSKNPEDTATHLYIANNSGLKKVDRRNGSIEFEVKSKKIGTSHMTILPYDNTRFVASSKGHLFVMDLSGRVLRKTKIFKVFNYGVAMTLRNASTLIVCSSTMAIAYHPITHVKYWEAKAFNSRYPAVHNQYVHIDYGHTQCSILNDEDSVYIGGAGRIKKLDAETGKEIWNGSLKGCSNMFVMMMHNVERNLIWCGSRGHWYAVNKDNGNVVWKCNLKGCGRGHVTFAQKSKRSLNIDFVAQPFLQANWNH